MAKTKSSAWTWIISRLFFVLAPRESSLAGGNQPIDPALLPIDLAQVPPHPFS